jgi:hypothetical protein
MLTSKAATAIVASAVRAAIRIHLLPEELAILAP